MKALWAAVLVLVFSIGSVAQKQSVESLPEKYREWLNKDVRHIISDDEKDVFLQLENNEKRDYFIEMFWKERDPSPGSERNEFKEEHYRRLEHATKWFGRESGRPGWATDMGRIYIQLGEPKQKTSYHTHQRLMPMEIWFYQADPNLGVPPFFYTIFFKRHGVGEFILYDPTLHGPEGLVYQSAGQMGDNAAMLIAEYDPELAQASISLVPTEPADIENYRGRPELSSVQLMSQLDNIPNYRRDSTYARRILNGDMNIETQYMFSNEPLDANFNIMKMPNGTSVLNYSFHIPTEKLELGQHDDVVYTAMEVLLSVMTPDGQSLFSDSIEFDQQLDDKQTQRMQMGGFVFQDNHVVLPGRYECTLTVRNKVSKVFFTRTETIDVPFRNADVLQVMEPVLFVDSSMDQPMNPSSVGPYHYDQLRFTPMLDAELPRGQVLGVFYQIAAPANLFAGSEEPVTVNYNLVDENDATVEATTVYVPASQFDQYGTASLVWKLETEPLELNTEYELRITASHGNSESVISSQPFTLSQGAVQYQGLTKFGYPINFLSPEVFITQARMLINIGKAETAAGMLREVVDNYQVQAELYGIYANALVTSNQLGEAIDVYESLAVRYPEDADYRRELATLYLRTGNYTKAIGNFERLRLSEGDYPAELNLLGEAYFRNGNEAKAKEIWERSLELNPDQPRIRKRMEL